MRSASIIASTLVAAAASGCVVVPVERGHIERLQTPASVAPADTRLAAESPEQRDARIAREQALSKQVLEQQAADAERARRAWAAPDDYGSGYYVPGYYAVAPAYPYGVWAAPWWPGPIGWWGTAFYGRRHYWSGGVSIWGR